MKPEVMNWRSAVWLPVYLIGIGTITFFSTFSGRTSQGHTIGLWTSMVVCAAFALAIYYWAVNVALSTATIQFMIDEVVVPEEEGIATPGH
jgi:hypothetical protein